MIKFRKHSTAVEINIDEPGVYLFPHSSGDGKTYLCTLLKDVSSRAPVDSLTFSGLKSVDKIKLFDRSVNNLIMLDRYDMYAGEFLDEISEFSKTGIILVDCKSYLFPFEVKACDVYLYDHRLVVS